ncbi:C-C motif chemokine 27a [Brachyistius frenatus]|uniref:C-C motif chemokine 27a n=1 Tax=Brachyistius frenatus TaxID=100188 RepID=UPI0037E947F8
MDLKSIFVIVCLCALAITSTEAGIPRCCITTKREISRQILLKVHKWDVQEGSGACDIPALKLYVKHLRKPICAHLKVKGDLKRLQRQMKQNKQKRLY